MHLTTESLAGNLNAPLVGSSNDGDVVLVNSQTTDVLHQVLSDRRKHVVVARIHACALVWRIWKLPHTLPGRLQIIEIHVPVGRISLRLKHAQSKIALAVVMQHLKQEAVVNDSTRPSCVAASNQRYQGCDNLGLQFVGHCSERKWQGVSCHNTVVIGLGLIVVESAVKLSGKISGHCTDRRSILRRSPADGLTNGSSLLHTANKRKCSCKSLSGLGSLPLANLSRRWAPIAIGLRKLVEPTRSRKLSLNEPYIAFHLFPVGSSRDQISNLHKLVNILNKRTIPAQIRWPSAETLLRHNIWKASIRVHQVHHAIHERRCHLGVVKVGVHALGAQGGIPHPAQALVTLRAVCRYLHQVCMLRSNRSKMDLLQHFIGKIRGGLLLHTSAHCEAPDVGSREIARIPIDFHESEAMISESGIPIRSGLRDNHCVICPCAPEVVKVDPARIGLVQSWEMRVLHQLSMSQRHCCCTRDVNAANSCCVAPKINNENAFNRVGDLHRLVHTAHLHSWKIRRDHLPTRPLIQS
mmetsp:Transcript_40019/g.91516  ORF Transcript_40019/g.91516 Transcript_40019/m.91516 type:complete len:524 (+) Transcript_40019:399-1970(+)